MAHEQTEATTRTQAPEGRTLSIVAFVLAGVAIFIAPIILGPIAAILGGVAMNKGDPIGKSALAAGIAGTIIGLALGAAILLYMR
jgi:cytochrome c biogenesis protein CcdA